jgi:hypothetical protein
MSYIDQVSIADFAHSIQMDEEWEPEDVISGY